MIARTAKRRRCRLRSNPSPSAASRRLLSAGRFLCRGLLLASRGFGWKAAREMQRRRDPCLGCPRLRPPRIRNRDVTLHRMTWHRLEVPTALLSDGSALVIGKPDEKVLAEQAREHVADHECAQVGVHC